MSFIRILPPDDWLFWSNYDIGTSVNHTWNSCYLIVHIPFAYLLRLSAINHSSRSPKIKFPYVSFLWFGVLKFATSLLYLHQQSIHAFCVRGNYHLYEFLSTMECFINFCQINLHPHISHKETTGMQYKKATS